MTTKPLQIVSAAMSALGLEYGFGVYSGNAAGKIVYPYFVGEYNETPIMDESGLQEATFMLTGFHRGSWLELETAKEKIEKYFNKVSGKTVMADGGCAVKKHPDQSINQRMECELICPLKRVSRKTRRPKSSLARVCFFRA